MQQDSKTLVVDVRQTGGSKKYYMYNKGCAPEDATQLNSSYNALGGETLSIATDDYQNIPTFTTGWTYGVLYIPYKYHLNKGGNLNVSTQSLGGYLGYEYNWADFGYKIVGFAGPSTVAASNTSTAGAPSQSISTISVGGGALFSFPGLKSLQTGAVLGWDLAGGGKPVPKDTGRPWLAVSIGYSFAR